MSKKKADDRRFNPEKYHMNFYNECQALDKICNKDDSMKVRQVCGGFGLIIKQEGGF